jgi:hypothetical protein
MKAFILSLLIFGAASAQTTVQRTIGTAPPQEPSGRPSSASADAQIRAAIAAYRKSWEQMNEKTRKNLLSHGGQTPEQYERLLRQGSTRIPAAVNGAGQSAKSADADLDLDVLYTMKTSTQDLNVIRDANLQRVQTGGCAPELASRIADLKSRLELEESLLRGEETPPAEPAAKKSAARAGSSAAIADEWFKSPAKPAASSEPADSKASQLDAVLGLSAGEAPVAKPASEKPAEKSVDRKQAEIEISRIQTELSHLTGACKAAK